MVPSEFDDFACRSRLATDGLVAFDGLAALEGLVEAELPPFWVVLVDLVPGAPLLADGMWAHGVASFGLNRLDMVNRLSPRNRSPVDPEASVHSHDLAVAAFASWVEETIASL